MVAILKKCPIRRFSNIIFQILEEEGPLDTNIPTRIRNLRSFYDNLGILRIANRVLPAPECKNMNFQLARDYTSHFNIFFPLREVTLNFRNPFLHFIHVQEHFLSPSLMKGTQNYDEQIES